MNFWGILPYIIVGAIIIFALIKLAPLFAILFQLIGIAYWFLCNLLKWVTWPLRWCVGKIKKLLCKIPALSTMQATTEVLDDRLVRFGGFSTLALFIFSVVFAAISLLVFWMQGRIADSLRDVLLNNTFGSFIVLIQNGFSFTPGALLSASFASFLAHVCIGKADRVKWYIWIPYCVVFIGMSSILSTFLTGTFDAVGTWGYNSAISIWNHNGSTFVKVLQFVPLIVLAYFALVSLAIIIREYFCSILFGVLTLIVLAIVMLIVQAFKAPAALSDIISTILFLSSLIGIEKVRDIIEKDMTEKADADEPVVLY